MSGFDVQPDLLVAAAEQLGEAAAPVASATAAVCGGADTGHAGLSAALGHLDTAWSQGCSVLGADLATAGTRLVASAAEYVEADAGATSCFRSVAGATP